MISDGRRRVLPESTGHYGHLLARQTDLTNYGPAGGRGASGKVSPADDEVTVDHEKSRGTAYAAVTAHLAGDKELVSDCVYDLIGNPVDAAAAFIVLIIACGAMAELWGRAIQEEPAKAWAMYAAAVAQGVNNHDIRGNEPGPE